MARDEYFKYEMIESLRKEIFDLESYHPATDEREKRIAQLEKELRYWESK